MSPSAKLLLLGIGNPDRGDDGAGPLLAKKLAESSELKKVGVDITPHSGEGASLMSLWEETDLTIVVDAMKSGKPIGTIRRMDAINEKLPSGMFHYSSHLFSLAEAVEMARTLGQLPKSLIIYGIEGKNFSFGTPPTPEVEDAMTEVEKSVIKDFLSQ